MKNSTIVSIIVVIILIAGLAWWSFNVQEKRDPYNEAQVVEDEYIPCEVGDRKTEVNGDEFLCNKNGEWLFWRNLNDFAPKG